MGHLYVLLGLGALLLLAFSWSLYKRLAHRYRYPFLADESLLSPPQRAFLAVLDRALGHDYRVFARVRVADVIGVRPRLDGETRRRAFDRLGERTFDFLVCRAGTGTIACAVNLAPRSRLRSRPPRDDLDRICAAAGLPFVRFRAGDVYSVVEIEERVFAAMQPIHVDIREQAPPHADTDEVLAGLAGVMAADDRRARPKPALIRPLRESGPKPGQARAPVANRASPPKSSPASPESIQPRRAEPTLTPAAGDIDPGPAFHIDDDLGEDETPVRLRRR